MESQNVVLQQYTKKSKPRKLFCTLIFWIPIVSPKLKDYIDNI